MFRKRESMAGKKEDRRTKYTKQVIKDSFLKLLNKKSYTQLTVTELCRLAEINRGTFYLHYYDLEDVLDDILSELVSDTTDVIDHVTCAVRQENGCTYPFCDKIHNNPQYHPLFLDDTISSRIVEKLAEKCKESYVTRLMSHSLLTFQQAEAIFYFQMDGCLTINKLTLRNHCTDWKKIQSVIDRFIKAGIESFLIHDQRDE